MVTTEYSGMENCGLAGLNIPIRHTVQWRKARNSHQRIFNCFFSVPPRLPDMVRRPDDKIKHFPNGGKDIIWHQAIRGRQKQIRRI